MDKGLFEDLEVLRDFLEVLEEGIGVLSLSDKVDVGARLNAIAKTIERIDSFIKFVVYVELADSPGTVPGNTFKAELKIFLSSRVDINKLKTLYPEVYEACIKEQETIRVDYKTR